jgi:lipid A 3-O-deacylase
MMGSNNRIQKYKQIRYLILIVSIIGYMPAIAEEGISIGSGYGAAHIVPVRLGLQKDFGKQWAADSQWPIGGYWEASFYTMNGQRGPNLNSHKQLEAVALAGAFRFQRAEKIVIGWPYLELGLGLSWLSRKEIGGRNLGIHFQFEDRIGVGVRFGDKQQYDVSYRAIHFSNAYIGPSNHGINLHLLVLGYWFN